MDHTSCISCGADELLDQGRCYWCANGLQRDVWVTTYSWMFNLESDNGAFHGTIRSRGSFGTFRLAAEDGNLIRRSFKSLATNVGSLLIIPQHRLLEQ
jgi:hypothetical protein